MDKYNPTLQSAKKYLTSFIYSKCKKCGRSYYPPCNICKDCKSSCTKESNIKTAKLVSYTILYSCQERIDQKKPVVIGLIGINNDIQITSQIVDIDFSKLRIGMKLRPIMRKFFKDKLLGYIQYGIKFTKL